MDLQVSLHIESKYDFCFQMRYLIIVKLNINFENSLEIFGKLVRCTRFIFTEFIADRFAHIMV